MVCKRVDQLLKRANKKSIKEEKVMMINQFG
jgi:hypothetical protein